MKISICNIDPHNAPPLEEVTDMFDENADIIVLPEFWRCPGFDEGTLAENRLIENDFIKYFVKWQKDHPDKAVCTGSNPIYDTRKNCTQNMSFLIRTSYDGRQRIHRYRKIHTFKPTGEYSTIEPGCHKPFSVRTHVGEEEEDVFIGMSICYDLRFPTHFDYFCDFSIILVPSQWPEERFDLFRSFCRARAAERWSIVVGANTCGNSFCCGPAEDQIYLEKDTGDTSTFEVDLNDLPIARREILGY